MIGIIGAGNMGKAIASRINQKILISDTDKARLRQLKSKCITAARDNIDLTKRANVIILAVKPQHIAGVLKEMAPFVGAKSRTKSLARDKLIISIVAGVETSLIEKILGKVKVIRAMPNMSVLVGKGISAITRGRFASKKDLYVARRIFINLGEVIEVKEDFMDAITAVSGSGPAYYFLFTDVLEKAGIKAGLEKELARQLATATFIGAAASASAINISMQDFVKKVASKGGTTEAALRTFKQKGLDRIVKQAVMAAAARSRQLASSTKHAMKETIS